MHTHKSTIIFIMSLITTLIVCGALVTFFVVIRHKNIQTSEVLTVLENKIQKKRNMSTLKQKIAEVEPIQNKLNSYFVNPGEIDTFVTYLEELGTKAQSTVKVESVEVSPAVKNVVIVKISTEGDFSNVIRTLQLLENAPYALTVEQFTLNKRLSAVTTTEGGVTKTRQIPLWQSEISFTILSS